MRYNSSGYDPSNYKPISPGVYSFKVDKAKDDVSKANNEMIVLELLVTIPDRQSAVRVFDYLVSTSNSLGKIKSFCETVGLDFGNDDISAFDCEKKTGKARFILGEPKSNGNRYLEVAEYLSKQNKKAEEKPTQTSEIDDIPF